MPPARQHPPPWSTTSRPSSRAIKSPFTDLNPQGIEGMFEEPDVTELLKVLEDVRAMAA